MQLTLATEGVEIDAWLEDFIRTHVSFATWWHQGPGIERVVVALDRAMDPSAGPYVRCTLRAESSGHDAVHARATGRDVWETVQEAAKRLEVALWRPFPSAPPTAQRALAA